MKGATLRLLDEDDAERLKPFRLQALTDGYEAFHSSPEEWDLPIEAFRDLIRNGRTYAAFDADKRLIGIAMLGTKARTRIKTRHKCEIWSVYVAPEARGRGIARQLVSTCIEAARELGFEAIVLTVTSHNAAARQLYDRLGFEIFGIEKGHLKLADGRYLDDVMMQLDLVPSD